MHTGSQENNNRDEQRDRNQIPPIRRSLMPDLPTKNLGMMLHARILTIRVRNVTMFATNLGLGRSTTMSCCRSNGPKTRCLLGTINCSSATELGGPPYPNSP